MNNVENKNYNRLNISLSLKKNMKEYDQPC